MTSAPRRRPRRRGLLVALVAVAVLGAVGAVGPARPSVAAADPPPPVRILVVGDSISAPRLWQTEMNRILNANGLTHAVRTAAVSGVPCKYWVSRITALLAANPSDLVVLLCGTNDDPGELAYGEPATGWAFRSIVEAVHAFRPGDPIPILPALIQYSNPAVAPSWLWGSDEPRTNDILWTNMRRYLPPNVGSSWFVGIADLQRIPSTASYLDPGGIHPTALGYQTIGRLVYDEAARRMGWPPAPTPPPCGLDGHRPFAPPPAVTPC